MPKVTLTATQRQNRAFMAALRGGQARLGEEHLDTAQIFPGCQRTYYRRIKDPGTFTVAEGRVLFPRYFNDRQLCEAFGIEYNGCTPKQGGA